MKWIQLFSLPIPELIWYQNSLFTIYKICIPHRAGIIGPLSLECNWKQEQWIHIMRLTKQLSLSSSSLTSKSLLYRHHHYHTSDLSSPLPSLSLCYSITLTLCFDSVLFLCVITVLSVSQGQIDWANSMLQAWQLLVILSINESIRSSSRPGLTQYGTALFEEHKRIFHT